MAEVYAKISAELLDGGNGARNTKIVMKGKGEGMVYAWANMGKRLADALKTDVGVLLTTCLLLADTWDKEDGETVTIDLSTISKAAGGAELPEI